MTNFLHLLAALVSFYGAIGGVIVYRALQLSCRNCLSRDTCPNRREGFGRPVCVPPRSRGWFARLTLRGHAASHEA